jgi:site-specific DNA-methyltransferase (adenine-specific)
MIKVNKNLLRPNKFSEGIYGSFSLIKEEDALLLASIENEGILEPLIITKTNLVISGNRRLKVALCLTSIREISVVYSDINDDDLDEFVFIQYNQQRVKNVFQVAREFELIRTKFMVKQGVKDKERTEASKISQKTLLDNTNVSLSSVKRVLKAKRLKTELEKELNQNDNWNDDKSWEWIFQQGTIRKKEANSILRNVEEQIAEIKNYKISKSVSLIQNDRIHLIHGDSSDLSKYLNDEQVDCIPNSPPYFGAVRTYLQDDKMVKSSSSDLDQIGHEDDVDIYLENLMKIYRECKRVLKRSGSIFVNISDTRVDGVMMNINGKLIELMKKEGMSYVQTITWFKINPLYQSRKAFQPSMEYILHFVKDVNDYKWYDDWFGSEDEFLGNITYGDKDKNKNRLFRNTMIYYPSVSEDGDVPACQGLIQTHTVNNHYLTKILKEKGYELQHQALQTIEVPLVCLLSTTKPNDTVLDVFSGMATTGLVSIANNCIYYGVDKSEVYSKKASIRIQDFLDNNPHLVKIQNHPNS